MVATEGTKEIQLTVFSGCPSVPPHLTAAPNGLSEKMHLTFTPALTSSSDFISEQRGLAF